MTAAQVIADAPDDGFDLVIMNPPFTRATNHEGAHSDITNQAFAATRSDKMTMGTRMNRLGKGASYHGNAGIASRVHRAGGPQARARRGMETKAVEVWKTASRTHLNLDCTFGSQPLAVAFTDDSPARL